MASRAHHAARLAYLVAATVLLAGWTVYAFGGQVIRGPVVAVHDGDTLRIGQHIIRLAHIDAPELRQEYGQQARAALVRMCAGQWAEATVIDQDRHGRRVADVRCNGVMANRALVAAGYAWCYVRYNRDPEMAGLEAKAREQRAGLWQGNPVAPWQWRAAKLTAVHGARG